MCVRGGGATKDRRTLCKLNWHIGKDAEIQVGMLVKKSEARNGFLLCS